MWSSTKLRAIASPRTKVLTTNFHKPSKLILLATNQSYNNTPMYGLVIILDGKF
jgi:hypothetical protein